nr:reverse transcriptase domain-containing protein [Tanacetum cinerariifolium]
MQAKAWVEDSKGTEGVVSLTQWLEKMESVFHISGCAIDNQVKFATCTLLGAALTRWNGYVRTLGHEAAYARQILSKRPKTLDETIELANDLMDQKLRTYAERQNENKRKTDDSSRNNQQQPHKKQNVARAYTIGPGEKKVYTGDLPLCTKCNYLILGNVHPSVENVRGMVILPQIVRSIPTTTTITTKIKKLEHAMSVLKKELMRQEEGMLAWTLMLSRGVNAHFILLHLIFSTTSKVRHTLGKIAALWVLKEFSVLVKSVPHFLLYLIRRSLEDLRMFSLDDSWRTI